ncbi:hypothetical protein NA57DRAFT_28803, partial [Rhizodiscina lignyota]
ALASTLDHIHTNASQSEALTTFAEYAPPPRSAAGSEAKTLAGELVQGGISGLYSRLKASVGSSKESGVGSPTATTKSVDSGDDASVKSLKLKLGHKSTTSVGTIESSPVVVSPQPSQLKSPASSKFPEGQLSTGRLLPASSSASLKSGSSVIDHASPVSSRPQSRPASSSVDLSNEPIPARHVGGVQKTSENIPTIDTPKTSNTLGERPAIPNTSSKVKDADLSIDTKSGSSRLSKDQIGESETPIGLPTPKILRTGEAPLSRVSSKVSESSTLASPVSGALSVDSNTRMGSIDAELGAELTRSETTERPPLLHVSQSHLPGYRASRATSSDGDMSSVTTVAASRQATPVTTAEAAKLRSELAKAADQNVGQMRSRLLAKEFWMRDENAKDCFYCGDTFSTFRRKHHCRTCGQIFDAKCTSTIPGKIFGIGGTVRVCIPCEHIIDGTEDDSSIYSEEDDIYSIPGDSHSPVDEHAREQPADMGTPTIGIPVSRKSADQTKRRSAVLEFDGQPTLARPSSSRSLRSLSGRPHTPHKRHHSRHMFTRGMKSSNIDRAPFQGQDSEGAGKDSLLPAFHHDNIIDPDLAPFLSDEGSSDDETVSLFATLDGDKPQSPARVDGDKSGFNALFSSLRKGKSRGDRSHTGASHGGRDTDAASISSRHLTHHHSRKRNVSVNSISHARHSPRRTKSNSLLKGFPMPFGSSLALPLEPDSPIIRPHSSHSRITRSASMRGESAPPVELNHASLQHVRKMLKQMLQDGDIPSARSWERALMPILLKSTNEVNPDIRRRDFIDIRHYVKLKKISGGKPGDTTYVSGVVFTKNVALKTMPRSISHPRIIIVTFAIEYARHQQHFMSLEPVIAQEKEYLRNLVRRIIAFDPQVLLVQKNVSGLALKLLAEAGIAVVYNVKRSVLNAVSRCTQTKLISSVDKLVFDPSQVGHCGGFDVKTYVSDGIKKTYVWLSGCQADLGCTIVLRGAEKETLRRLKRITEFMCYVVYNLRLETYLMRDEFVLIPTTTTDGTISPSKAQMPLLPSSETSADPENSNTELVASPNEQGLTESGSLPSFYEDIVEKHKTKILSTSPFVKFMPPYLLMQAREQESRLTHLKQLRDQYKPELGPEKSNATNKFQLVQPEMVQGVVQKASKQVREFLYAVHDAEYDKAMHNYLTQKRQWESYLAGTINLFDPLSHQRIAFLYSMVNSQSTTPCIGPEIIALEFYNEQEIDEGFATDITLGQYVEDLIHGAGTICGINGCERNLFAHHRQYVHGPGQMAVYVQRHPPKLPGMQNTILMWSQCRICGQETQVLAMSDSTWKYSFGKYLELTFWSSELHPRANVCPHDIHHDHVRFFGLHGVVVRIQYDPIQLHEVVIPRSTITWKVDSDLKLKNEQYQRIKERLDRFMQSVKSRIKSIHVDGVLPEKMDPCRTELDRLTKAAQEDHEQLTKKLQEKYMKSRYYEIIPFNRAMRFMHEKAIWWDDEFAAFEKNFFPSEKDIRRLAEKQLRKLFIEKDESTTTIDSIEEEQNDQSEEMDIEPKQAPDIVHLQPSPSHLSAEDAESMLMTGLEKVNSQEGRPNETEVVLPPPIELKHSRASSDESNLSLEGATKIAGSPEVKHLDLAIPADHPSNPPSDVKESAFVPSRPAADAETRETCETSVSRTPTPTLSNLSDSDSLLAPPRDPNISKIPRLVDKALPTPPPLSRAHSQPSEIFRRQLSSNSIPAVSTGKTEALKMSLTEAAKGLEKRLTERLSGTLRAGRTASHSLIPRSVPSKQRFDTKVSTLARHFEQLSRELERERLRERRLRTERTRQARAYPLASSRPTVEVYPDAHQAVQGRVSPEDESLPESPARTSTETVAASIDQSISTDSTAGPTPTELEESHESAEHIEPEAPQPEEQTPTASDAEGEGSDVDLPEGLDKELLSPIESPDILELPKHEKTSIMKMLRNFWSERSASGWTPLEYPLLPSEHVWENSDVIVREDEPSSIIALALSDGDYLAKLREFREKASTAKEKSTSVYGDDKEHVETLPLEDDEASIERNLLSPERTHIIYAFQYHGVKARCKIFYAESFDALRRKAGVADRFVESLSRCLKWDSKGGKTKSLFLKTMDDRFVLKSLSQPEVNAFFKFAPNYFAFSHQILFKGLPSVIAKMLGLFQITVKNPATGVEFDWFMLVMENLFYHREPDRRFDLKGSMRNRKIQKTGERDEVLQDENLVDIIFENPIFVREHTMTLLQACVWNDTLFLSQQNVMDYSMMAGFIDDRFEIVVGIIDCIRTYTWDKKLETWIKDRGKNKPTITSPKDYKNRFRIAMSKYILLAPNCWHHFS